jgi:hypothetical protein
VTEFINNIAIVTIVTTDSTCFKILLKVKKDTTPESFENVVVKW